MIARAMTLIFLLFASMPFLYRSAWFCHHKKPTRFMCDRSKLRNGVMKIAVVKLKVSV